MNKIEELKAAKDGLDVGAEIETFAAAGWESIPEDDRDSRLKWWGIFYRKQTPGHFMIRIRIPNGILSAAQLSAIGQLANRYGRGTIDLTTRQQVQLRWIRIEDIPAILAALREVGLVTLQTGLDNIRGVAGCPVAGLTPNELLDASPVARAFTARFVGDRRFTNLPRKFNVTVTGCKENCTHAETQDVGLVPARLIAEGREIAGFNVLVGGKMGSGGYVVAQPLDAFVTAEDATDLLEAIVLLFSDYGSREARARARLAFLIEDWGIDRFRNAVEERLGRTLPHAGEDARFPTTTDHIGAFPQRQAGLNYVGLLVPVGRTTGDQMQELALLANTYGSGEVRLTVSQNVIVVGVPGDRLAEFLGSALLQDLRPDPSDIARGTIACTGIEYCGMALIESKGHAFDTIRAIEATVSRSRPVTVHWSGCPAGCGLHQAADIGLLGRKIRIDDQVIETVDIYVGGSSGPEATPAVKFMENVPCSEASQTIAFLMQHVDFKQLRQELRARGAVVPAPQAPHVEVAL